MMGRRRAAVLGSARRLYFVQDRLGRYGQAKARDGRIRNTRGPMLASTPPNQPPAERGGDLDRQAGTDGATL